MSSRNADGTRKNERDSPEAKEKRVNAWHDQFAGGNGARGQGRKANGEKAVKERLLDGADGRDQWGGTPHKSSGTGRGKDGEHKGKLGTATSGHVDGDTQTAPESYDPPVLANSGNKIMETYTAAEVDKIVGEANDVRQEKVGGGQMGSKTAHESEAPFPETLVRFFIVSYCPPGGTVLDPFCGSGTSISVAVQENRNAIGIDIRDGKGGLASARKRLGSVTPAGLFALETEDVDAQLSVGDASDR